MAEEVASEHDEEWMRHWTPLAFDYGDYHALRAGSIDGTDTTPHDRGIVRAMKANYKPPKDLDSDPYNTLFVGRINHDTTEDTLRAIFSECGTIKSMRLVRDIVSGRSKGYAFVEYERTDEAEKAYQRCHKMSVDGYQIIVEFECGRKLPGWVPRRLGGGFGGKKESGQLRFGGRERPFRKPIVLGSKTLGLQGRRGGHSGGGVWRGRKREEGRERGREGGSWRASTDRASRHYSATRWEGHARNKNNRRSRSRSPR